MDDDTAWKKVETAWKKIERAAEHQRQRKAVADEFGCNPERMAEEIMRLRAIPLNLGEGI